MDAKDQLAVLALGRLMYEKYCDHNRFDGKPAPYVPGWATDYARIAIDAFGYDDDGLDDALTRTGMKVG